MSGDLSESSKSDTERSAAARKTVLELARLLAQLAAREDDAVERKSRQGSDAADGAESLQAPSVDGEPIRHG